MQVALSFERHPHFQQHDRSKVSKVELLALLAVGAVLAGCAGPPEEEATTDADRFAQLVVETQQMMAADSQVDQEQYDLLDVAATRGELTLDDLTTALRGNAECLEAAGFKTGGVVVDTAAIPASAHLAYLTPPADMPENQAMALINGCDARYFKYVSRVYGFQPQSQNAYWEKADELAPQIRACLEEQQIPRDLIGESTAEVVNAALKLKDRFEEFAAFEPVDCMSGLPDPTANR